MNGVPEYYELKLKQTSKGIWYCDGFTQQNKTIEGLAEETDTALTWIENVLHEHNKEEKPDASSKEQD
jgi:hypothetical protein